MPSAALVAYAALREDRRFALIGYAVLLGHPIVRPPHVARAMRTQHDILAKYEDRSRRRESAASTAQPPIP